SCEAEMDVGMAIGLNYQNRHALAGPHRCCVEQELLIEWELIGRRGGAGKQKCQEREKHASDAASHSVPTSLVTSHCAVRSNRASSPGAPTSCTPSGMASSPGKNGSGMAGRPSQGPHVQ